MAKRILLLTQGTRGDVDPFVALGVALQQRGYSVRLGAPVDHEDYVEGYGLPFVRCGESVRRFLDRPEVSSLVMSLRGSLEAPRSTLKGLKVTRRVLESTLRDSLDAAREADAVIAHPVIHTLPDIAEGFGIPTIVAALQPTAPTAKHPITIVPSRTLGGPLNRASFQLYRMQRWMLHKEIGELRREFFDLPPPARLSPAHALEGRPFPILHAFSTAVAPEPEDQPPYCHQTGYWFLEPRQAWTPPDDFRRFLDAGETPIYAGFGSMPAVRRTEVTRAFGKALKSLGLRAVVATGWGALDSAILESFGGTIFPIRDAPHPFLFPMMRAVVHHGGAGTTAAGLRSGKPTLTVPFAFDQYWWGRRVHELGVGPAPLPVIELSQRKLEARLAELVGTPSYASAAHSLAERIAGEDGLGDAVRHIANLIGPA